MKITWILVWFCITPSSQECMSLHNREVSSWYYSEDSCMVSAERRADDYWNEKRLKLEYDCVRRDKPWDYYIPTRRPGGVPK